MEDSMNISNSQVSIQTVNSWKKLGTTNSGYSFFDLADMDSPLDVKIEWDDGSAPTFMRLKLTKPVDFT